jgi:integrase
MPDHWKTALTRWERWMIAAGTPATTRSLRTYYVRRFATETGKPLAKITTRDLIDWTADYDWSPNTRRTVRTSLRAFWRYATSVHITKTNPALGLPSVTIPRPMPTPTPETIYRNAIDQADPRTRLALLLGGQCGLRRGEIAATHTRDLEDTPTGPILRVRGKGGHVRLVPLTNDIAATIRATPPGWLFPSTQGGHLTAQYVAKLITTAIAGWHTHSLRHRCGTTAYAALHDLRAVQELLGHARPDITAAYCAVTAQDVRKAMEACR